MKRDGSSALEEVDEALSRERALAQLLDEIMPNVFLPHAHVGADECAHERVRIVPCRPVEVQRSKVSKGIKAFA